MKHFITKVIASILVFSLVISAFSPKIYANTIVENSKIDAQELKDLTEALEYVFEQAMVKDELGQVIGIDFNKIEEKYGNSPDLEKVENATGKKKHKGIIAYNNPGLDRCIERKVKDFFTSEDLIPTVVISSVIAYIKEKDYKSAALRLLRAGIKGNAVGIAASMGGIFFTCLYQERTWP
ncbi:MULTISPECIES: hypothetical protein [unclassified Lysinibacillus]|uniref:hypothetical protein n=1 Tax=unclassified Lysinibacillus TaxID=2636778 RepID=UPI0037F43D46